MQKSTLFFQVIANSELARFQISPKLAIRFSKIDQNASLLKASNEEPFRALNIENKITF